ncbi:glycosyltransferase family 2 protein [Allofournierella sp. CML151]|uniref:glycosyltransferase family 2 protein n=1 Tax=Allofournierella sp. CML151 TaxID=2998082 RepID=UPI0022EBA06D|nr:glycosyltransferase family 2 protein [Fournierella sp. CML151]
MAKQNNNQPLPADVAQKDSVGGMARRLLDPAHVKQLAAWCAQVAKEEGGQALWREISFRVNLALHRDTWQYRADLPTRRMLKHQRAEGVPGGPKISVVVPLYNTPLPFLKQMIESVTGQSYQNWQLVLADASDEAHANVGAVARKYAARDERITYKKLAENQGIAGNTNQGYALANGDWLTLLDHDDVLYRNALHEVAKAAVAGADFVYSDEIVLSADLKHLVDYHFKPDFEPDYLRGCNYITHLAAFSRGLFEATGGGERVEYDGSQDFELILRLTEKAKKIVHIPYALYIWRSHAASTASSMDAKPYALAAGERALNDHLKRVGLAGEATRIPGCPGAYRVRYELTGTPLISIMIPNKDHVEDLSRCLESLYKYAGYSRFEVIVIENNSTDPATFKYYEKAKQQFANLQVVKYEGGFNFSAINNFGRKFAKGEQLLLLNNDVELLSEGFLAEMLMYSQRPDVGCVGAKLYFPDDTIQHAGVFLGINGTAGHSHKSHPRASAGDLYRLATPQDLMAVTGACLMVKASLYDACGGLDEEKFAVAYNDIDLCLKLWQQGLLNVFTPFAEAYHHESKSRGLDTLSENAKRYEREKANFIEKYTPLIQKGDPYYNRHFNLLFENYGLK